MYYISAWERLRAKFVHRSEMYLTFSGFSTECLEVGANPWRNAVSEFSKHRITYSDRETVDFYYEEVVARRGVLGHGCSQGPVIASGATTAEPDISDLHDQDTRLNYSYVITSKPSGPFTGARQTMAGCL